jgi:hypothetical protein
LSCTTISEAIRLVVSGARPVSSLTISSTLRPGDGVAVALHVELARGRDLLAGRGERPGHRQDQADLHRGRLREREARQRAERGGAGDALQDAAAVGIDALVHGSSFLV